MIDPMNMEHLQGLDPEQAALKLGVDGPNELNPARRRTLLNIVWEVVREPMFLLLLGAGAVYWVIGDAHEAMALLGFVVIIVAVTVLQERRTDRALDTLRDLSSPRALVLRGGVATRIAGREVVTGDLLVLSEGDRVAADGQVLQAHELATDESMLTGESVAVAKQSDQDSVFAGTLVVRGQGLVRVTATGEHTELGRIGHSLQGIEFEASPLREEVAKFTRRLVWFGLVVCLLFAGAFWMLRGSWLEALLASITLAMSLLPQEFPVIMIVFFALGARRMAVRQVLTRRLNAIEALGETTVLCVDKTGTLTQNRMTVAALSVHGEVVNTLGLESGDLPKRCHELLEYAVLASEIDPHDPMEQAFHALAAQHLEDTHHLHPEWALAREYELSPELLAMSHLWRDGSGQHDVVAAKGAPEAMAELCHLPAAERAVVAAQAAAMADQGLRVLAVAKARHHVAQEWPTTQHDFDFEWLGLIGLADPLREQVPQAVAQCRQAGIRVVMITGDHPRTARAIATQAGLNAHTVLTGADLQALDDAELARRVAGVDVFARVSPQQKLMLVRALQARGEVVAMTGDGVNDAPALKAAHIGIAMGQRGTDVAREAASLVLLHDDFSAIVDAIRLGRRIFANLRQALIYTLAVHIPIIVLSVLPVLLGLPLVLLPIHIAFLELVIDPSCSVVFEAQEDDARSMQQPPRVAGAPLITWGHVVQALFLGGVVSAAVVGLYWAALGNGWQADVARTAAFAALVCANALLILLMRSKRQGWQQAWLKLGGVTGWVLGGTGVAVLLVTTWPLLASTFGFATLGWLQWGGVAATVLGAVFSLQMLQWLAHRKGWLLPDY
jgi:Ca2+-transporting ATPase